MQKSTLDALIVGAGPVGLTAAAALTQHGMQCRIIDKAAAPSDKSKALAIWCRTMELLDGLELADTFVRTGMKLSGGSMYAEGKRVVHLSLTTDESPFGFPLMIPQNETERLLAQHLSAKGIVVERPVELETFRDNGSVVACSLRHADGRQEQVNAAWLVGCDGAHSTVRHTLGMEFTGHAEPNDWMLADVHIEGPLANDEVSIFWREEGVVAFFPITRDRFRMIADLGEATGALRPDPTLADAQQMVDVRGPSGLKLSNPIWLANFRINERKVSDYCRGRVLLAGDAAHIHSPAGGQGMNTGMQDAFNLAWKLALVQSGKGKLGPLLDSYSVERSAVGDQVLKNAARFTTIATLRSPVAQWLRNHIAPVLGSLSMVRDKMRDDWFELSINYRHSPLSRDSWPALTGGIAAGDRMCDAPLTSLNAGQKTTLFQMMRTGGHLLLLLPASAQREAAESLVQVAESAERAFPGVLANHLVFKAGVKPSDVAPSAISCWSDSADRLHQKLHANRPSLFVVRPDGYVGFRCQPPSEQRLLEYLDGYLLRTGTSAITTAPVLSNAGVGTGYSFVANRP